MNASAGCAAVIPCLNEQSTIGPLVRAVRSYVPTVFLVDDGSVDQTAEQGRQAGAVVLRHSQTQGKGAALTTGWREACRQGFMWGLSLDGDGQHSPEDIPALQECVSRTSAALVIGNRMHDPESMPWVRRGVNRWMSRRLSRMAGQWVPDSQCGFRLMNLQAWTGLPINSTHFEIESEVLLAFIVAGLRVSFAPIRVIYRCESSKIHPVWDTIRWFRWYWRTTGLALPRPVSPLPPNGECGLGARKQSLAPE